MFYVILQLLLFLQVSYAHSKFLLLHFGSGSLLFSCYDDGGGGEDFEPISRFDFATYLISSGPLM